MDILIGFQTLFSNPTAILFVFLGAIVGVVVGALPGMTASAAIAMLVPITFYLDPLPALAFLYVIGKSGRFGGSIAAILFNTPGTAASAATMIDGYPMTQKGQAGKALKTAAIASAIGDFSGELLLIFGAVMIAIYTERMGPPEYFAVYVMAFVVIGSVIGKSITKGLLSTLFGILCGLIGTDPITAEARYDFGLLELQNGLPLVPLLIGVFVIAEVLAQAERDTDWSLAEKLSKDGRAKTDHYMTWQEFKTSLPVMLRSTGIGAFVGLMPGLGSAVACFIAYGEEKRRSKNPERWGTGIVEGVAAPESSNNAVSGPSMIPLLTLGIPGSTIAAIITGVFLIHGIIVGPAIFKTSKELVFGLFASGLLGIAIYALIGYFGGPLIGRMIAAVPARLIYPFVFLTAFVAAYSTKNSTFDIILMGIFGIIGYVMRRFDFSAAAFIIAFVLTKGAEENLRQALILTNDGWGIFLQRPVALLFFGIGFLAVAVRAYKVMRREPSDKAVKN
ncbi:MAG: tripartite tricarboxylate transporter permease [Rhodospirillaceae bacterium]|jgi:putative tricarboxylic transport membrane protein